MALTKSIYESGNFLFIYLLLDIIHNIKLSVIHVANLYK